MLNGHIKEIHLFLNRKNKYNVILPFDTVNQDALAILSLHNFIVKNQILKINYLITKY